MPVSSRVALPVLVALGAMKLKLLTVSGRKIPVAVEKDATVDVLRKKIERRIGIAAASQHLRFDATVLQDGVSLQKYGITSGSHVHLTVTTGTEAAKRAESLPTLFVRVLFLCVGLHCALPSSPNMCTVSAQLVQWVILRTFGGFVGFSVLVVVIAMVVRVSRFGGALFVLPAFLTWRRVVWRCP